MYDQGPLETPGNQVLTLEVIDLPEVVTPELETALNSDDSTEVFYRVQADPDDDWFNTDFDQTLEGRTVTGISFDIANFTTDLYEKLPRIGLYPESLVFPNVPDLANPVVETQTMRPRTNQGLSRVAVPAIALDAGDYHVAAEISCSDTGIWYGVDSDSPYLGRSFGTTNDYASGAWTFADGNLRLGLTVVPETGNTRHVVHQRFVDSFLCRR